MSMSEVPMSTNMTYDEWWDKYKPKPNDVIGPENAPFDGAMFETAGPEMKEVCMTNAARVWTLVYCDGVSYVINGLHFVNRLGYFICEVPYEGDYLEVRVDDELTCPYCDAELVVDEPIVGVCSNDDCPGDKDEQEQG